MFESFESVCLFVLQVLVSVILLLNKWFVLQGRRGGWIAGFIGCFLAVFYLYFIGLYVFTVFEVGLAILMLYGYWSAKNKTGKFQKIIRGIMIVTMLLVAWFTWSGLMTVSELLSSLALMVGTYFLAVNKIKSGWFFYLIGHLLCVYLGFIKGQFIFALFQFLSVMISILGIIRDIKDSKNGEYPNLIKS